MSLKDKIESALSIMFIKIIVYAVLTVMFLGGSVIDNYTWSYEFNYVDSDVDMNLLQHQFRNNQDKLKSYIYHEYSDVNKNSYQNSVYTVKSGDTLFYIAWITGNNYLDLAKNNNIKNINILRIGQILKVKQKKIFFCKSLLKRMVFFIKQKIAVLKSNKIVNVNNMLQNINSFYTNNNAISLHYWNWPTHGQIINTFSDMEGGNKGIDISGVLDQPILAATNGIVIYVGNTLQGYGNLVIIKHNNNFLSAYAHNNKVLVIEQQRVKQGDLIATMGSTGTYETKLHFEIRYKGRSVNPLFFLPKN